MVEMLIATAISGLMIAGLVTAVYHIVTNTEYASDKMTAVHELGNIAHWFNIDGQGASTASGGDELILTLPDDSSITYTLVGTELHRTAGVSQITLARNISDISFTVHNRIITMTVTSSSPGRDEVSKQGVYKVYLRSLEEG